MLVDLSNMQLGVRGTRLNINIDADGSSKVALAEDSFGNVGEISLSSEGQTTNLNRSNLYRGYSICFSLNDLETITMESKYLPDGGYHLCFVHY